MSHTGQLRGFIQKSEILGRGRPRCPSCVQCRRRQLSSCEGQTEALGSSDHGDEFRCCPRLRYESFQVRD